MCVKRKGRSAVSLKRRNHNDVTILTCGMVKGVGAGFSQPLVAIDVFRAGYRVAGGLVAAEPGADPNPVGCEAPSAKYISTTGTKRSEPLPARLHAPASGTEQPRA